MLSAMLTLSHFLGCAKNVWDTKKYATVQQVFETAGQPFKYKAGCPLDFFSSGLLQLIVRDKKLATSLQQERNQRTGDRPPPSVGGRKTGAAWVFPPFRHSPSAGFFITICVAWGVCSVITFEILSCVSLCVWAALRQSVTAKPPSRLLTVQFILRGRRTTRKMPTSKSVKLFRPNHGIIKFDRAAVWPVSVGVNCCCVTSASMLAFFKRQT